MCVCRSWRLGCPVGRGMSVCGDCDVEVRLGGRQRWKGEWERKTYISPLASGGIITVLGDLEPCTGCSIGGSGVVDFGHVDYDWAVVSSSDGFLGAVTGVVLVHFDCDFATSCSFQSMSVTYSQSAILGLDFGLVLVSKRRGRRENEPVTAQIPATPAVPALHTISLLVTSLTGELLGGSRTQVFA